MSIKYKFNNPQVKLKLFLNKSQVIRPLATTQDLRKRGLSFVFQQAAAFTKMYFPNSKNIIFEMT